MSETRYFFGYYRWMGSILPVCWVEVDGKAVGGGPLVIKSTKVEIPVDDFDSLGLVELIAKHPFKEDVTPSS